ncbi:hypothetical protein RNI52_11945, partial [Labrys neptuniae]|uniref:hypothetical protein n=1 Tax=Labrys neptuniae TaxID=376174 RepID=UPI00289091E1
RPECSSPMQVPLDRAKGSIKGNLQDFKHLQNISILPIRGQYRDILLSRLRVCTPLVIAGLDPEIQPLRADPG